MKKLRFLVSLTTNDNDYQIEQAQSAEQMARKLDAEVRIIYADNDAITQSTQILKEIQSDDEAQRPNAIVFEPVGGTALPQVARAAASAGIGWAVLNRDANYVPELRRTSAAPVFTYLRPSRNRPYPGPPVCRTVAPWRRRSLHSRPCGKLRCQRSHRWHARNQAGEYSCHLAARAVDRRKFSARRPVLAETKYLPESGH